MNWRTSGRRVTIPLPRGKKEVPTIDSITDDFPELYDHKKYVFNTVRACKCKLTLPDYQLQRFVEDEFL